MSIADFESIMRQLKKYDIREAKLMGMGEPFMHPQFGRIVRIFKETFPNSYLISATNGQVAFSDNYKQALEHLDVLYLSIDGTRKNYEEIRKGSSWDKLLKFLEQISKVNTKCLRPINFTICPQNVYDIPGVIDLQKQFGLDDIRLNFVQNWDEKSKATELNGFSQDQLDFLAQFRQYFKGKPVWDYSDCFWVKDGLYVTVDGNVKVCCMNTSATPVGNIFRQPIELIHRNKEFLKIKDGCMTNTPTSHCATCSYKELTPFLSKVMNDKA
jgi:MoaA/NifB/PqqE/SkfB family radical SAM enzyme